MKNRIGRYEVIETLGKGGMGVVYRARDPELDRQVAIKVVLGWAQYDPDTLGRFQREARVVAGLQHPHIVTVFDAGRTDDGLPYFVMEFLEGTDLGEILDREGRLSPDRAIRYTLQICDGLSYAHARGIVHRDIKPANLRITPDDDLKIVDFGIAMLVGARITGSGVSLGTPLYMAPEQVAGAEVDHRADLFAVGGVLYTLLSGRSPFEAPTVGAICRKIEQAEPEPLPRLGVDVSNALTRVIGRALAKAPTDRPPSASGLADELRAVPEASGLALDAHEGADAVAVAPTVVTPRPAHERGAGRGRRRAAALTGLAVLALVAALWAWPRQVDREADTAAGTAGLGAPDAAAVPDRMEPTRATRTTGPTDDASPRTADAPRGERPLEAEAPAGEGAGATASPNAGRADDRSAATTLPEAIARDPWPEIDVGPLLEPVGSAERARIATVASSVVRALESRDSAALADAFGGPIPPRDWRAVSRWFEGPRVRIRSRILNAAWIDDERVVAEVAQDVLFLGRPGQAPPPRRTVVLLLLAADETGALRLRGLRRPGR